MKRSLFLSLLIPGCTLALAAVFFTGNVSHGGGKTPATKDLGPDYTKNVQPLLKKYCFECHSTKVHKSGLDLERFTTLDAIRKDVKPWQHLLEQVEVSEMPPRGKPQPSEAERKLIVAWTRTMLDAEARARTGDPGHVPLRRLSNAEYDCTIRDLTGLDLKPTREFPADGAAGEGFTNAAESLSDVTPTLFARYLNAAKDISDHAVLLPDGFRFSPGKTRRDWTDESIDRLRKFYARFAPGDGRLVLQPYLLATVRHRDALSSGKMTTADVAFKEKLHPKYLGVLWQTLNDKTPSHPLDRIRSRWKTAGEKDVASIAAEITDWQKALWRFIAIGSYAHGSMVRQVANGPAASNVQPVKLAMKPVPGQSEVTVYLSARDFAENSRDSRVIWQRPRFEGAGKTPILLANLGQFALAEIDHAAFFADAARYLSATAQLAHDKKLAPDEVAQRNKLDPAKLKRWVTLLALVPVGKETLDSPAITLELLDQKSAKNAARPAINGWHKAGTDLPVLVSNSSGATLNIPGTVPGHKVAVHPTPKEFVAVTWKSPIAGKVVATARIKHAHPACGNGVAWWLEQRRAGRATTISEGVLDVGKEVDFPGRTLNVEAGDIIVLAVDARDGNHVCDLTEINLTLTDANKAGRVWDLSADVADSVLDGNPHADKRGNKDVWSFVRGLSKTPGKAQGGIAAIPAGSLLGQWRIAAANPAAQADAERIAAQVQKLLTGPRPTGESDPNRVLFDAMVAADGALLKGLDLTRFIKAPVKDTNYGLPKERFRHPDGKAGDGTSIHAAANEVIEIRLPAAIFRDREFVVEGKLDGPIGDHVVLFQATFAPPGSDVLWNGKSPIVGSTSSAGYKRMLAGFDAFRQVFPWFICFPNVVPTDEVVCLKMFHREDEPLDRLFLDAEQKARIDHLWTEHTFIGRQPTAENNYLPQFIGFVTQDQPKSLVEYFEGMRPAFKKKADDFEQECLAAEPKHLTLLTDFAGRAYRRPLLEKEKSDLTDLYQKIRKKGASHDEAFRGVLSRVLVTPAFLFRIEKAPPGAQPGPIDDWELATRLSYFLWSSMPDDGLRQLAAAGKLRDSKILAEQTRRMLKDDRLRSLAIEFGTQWIHVRNLDTLKEKNEKLFPTFTPALRGAIYEESILFFQDLFQNDRPATRILDADYTFLNEMLAKHYGIPGVTGPQWRRVEGVRKYGRGGILGLASVHAKQSGASRTSPVLRGNWVVETLLGEKLPRPPANVPILPDEEGTEKLTTRQQVEKHVSNPSCAVCHVRIDPLGFAFENFDPIGRRRVKESSGLPVDARTKLKDGTEFEGIDGLRTYLLAKKKDVIVRLFCQKLLGYSLGRATTLSDTTLIDEMVAELSKNEERLSAAVLTIVRSPQFRMIRGSEAGD